MDTLRTNVYIAMFVLFAPSSCLSPYEFCSINVVRNAEVCVQPTLCGRLLNKLVPIDEAACCLNKHCKMNNAIACSSRFLIYFISINLYSLKRSHYAIYCLVSNKSAKKSCLILFYYHVANECRCANWFR